MYLTYKYIPLYSDESTEHILELPSHYRGQIPRAYIREFRDCQSIVGRQGL